MVIIALRGLLASHATCEWAARERINCCDTRIEILSLKLCMERNWKCTTMAFRQTDRAVTAISRFEMANHGTRTGNKRFEYKRLSLVVVAAVGRHWESGEIRKEKEQSLSQSIAHPCTWGGLAFIRGPSRRQAGRPTGRADLIGTRNALPNS